MPYIFPKSRNASSRDILRTTRASTMNRRSVDSISGTTSLVASIERATGSYSSGVADGTRLLSIESRAAASASSLNTKAFIVGVDAVLRRWGFEIGDCRTFGFLPFGRLVLRAFFARSAAVPSKFDGSNSISRGELVLVGPGIR